MLPTNSSANDTEYYDYEVMFKKHVHGRILLNDDLRMLDVMKKSKLKELNRDKDVFINRFSKYNQAKSVRTLPDVYFTRNTTPRSVSKSSFIVCRTSPCSFKTWHNLTDITKENIDVYKSEVLQTDDSRLSFRTPTHDSEKEENNSDRKSALLLRKSTSMAILCSDSVDGQKAEPRTDELVLPDFRQRSSTIPCYRRKSKNTNGDKKAVSKNNSKINESSPTQNCVNSVNSITGLPGGNKDVHQTFALSNTDIGITDCSSDVSAKHTDLHVTFALDENITERNSNRRTLSGRGCVQVREKSNVAQRSQETNPLVFRRRRSSMESTVTEQSLSTLAGKLAGTRPRLSVPKLYLEGSIENIQHT